MDAASALSLNNLFTFEACNGRAILETFRCRDWRAPHWCRKSFASQLEGYGLTTANILYRRPDHPWLLQTYVWQDYYLCPNFPVLNKFLNFWLEKLEGPAALRHRRPCPVDQARRDPRHRRRVQAALIPASLRGANGSARSCWLDDRLARRCHPGRLAPKTGYASLRSQ